MEYKTGMDPTAQVEVIVELLGKLGVQVRYEHLGGEGGGICHIRGDRVLFVDIDADMATTAERCLEALAGTTGADQLHLPREIRDQLEKMKQ